ncbi:MAG TPA: hypothetical protein VNF72_17390 [Myxococcota bacterium]|nr:hypothetical protein [Myxococcota bacterium]
MSRTRAAPDPAVGLCSVCAHASVQRNRRSSAFWRCRAADTDARLRRYPPLPVRACPAWREGAPESSPTG